jgi:hypothetical protein
MEDQVRGYLLVELIKDKVMELDEGAPENQYLSEWLMSLGIFARELLEETPDMLYVELKQRVEDNIINLDYIVKNTEDGEKKELYQVALDGFKEIEKEIVDNNL